MAPPYLSASRLYERKAVTQLWNKLTAVAKQQWKWKNVADKKSGEWPEARKRLLQVHGPPGGGKSSAVFRWLATVCTAFPGRHSLWIDCSDENGECWRLQWQIGSGLDVADDAAFPTPDTDALITVFDGIQGETVETWVRLIFKLVRVGIPVVVVSSEGVMFHAGSSNDAIMLEHFVPSWVKPEYYEACRDDQFWKRVHLVIEGANETDIFERRKELLDTKFLTAGYSARFMFQYEAHEIINQIKGKAKKVKLASLEDAVKADRSAGHVNTLIARLDNEQNGTTSRQEATFPSAGDIVAVASSNSDLTTREDEKQHSVSYPRLVSAEATEAVVKGLPSEVQKLREVGLALDNNAIVGYALEGQLKKKLTEATNTGHSLVLRLRTGQQRILQVSQVIPCSNESQVKATLRARDSLARNSWIFIAGRRVLLMPLTSSPQHTFDLSKSPQEHHTRSKLAYLIPC